MNTMAEKVSGPSGKHINPRRQITQTEKEFKLQDRAAKAAGADGWAPWAKSLLEREARKILDKKGS